MSLLAPSFERRLTVLSRVCVEIRGYKTFQFECDSNDHLVWLFAINRTTIPRIYNCSELVCAIVDLGIVGLSVMCAHCGHNLFTSLCKN